MPRGVGHRPPEYYGHEGFKWKDDLPPDYTAEELRSYLPGKNVGTKFIEWYRQDVKGRGMTVPFMKYSGPGNPTNIGEPVNEADKFAKIHDLEYAYAKFRHNKGLITDEQFKKEIDAADIKFMKSNGWNVTSSMDPREQLASIIGGLGIGVKYGAESAVGQIYPSLEQDNSVDVPTTSSNLASQLMKNLQNNVSRSQTTEQSSSMSTKGKKSNSGDRVETGSSGGDAELPHKSAGGGTVAVDPANIPQDIEMANLTGTGKEQASGGASSDGMMVHYIEKPISIFGAKTSTYKKVHKFMTFGLADAIIRNGATADGNCFLTSFLAEVPWHIPALYLNQSEFDLLPPGSRVSEVAIEVIYRGSTIQFETAQSNTGLATLNQINDIAVAHALNRTGWGSNVSYVSFNSDQPMIPTQINPPKYAPDTAGAVRYKGMVRDFYGSNNDATTFTGDIPKHQTGRQTFLYNYWSTTQRDAATTTTAANRMFGGWPCIAEKIKQMDGKTVVNQCVAKSTYKPKLGCIKSPHRMRSHGLPFPIQNAGINVPVGGNLVASRTATIQNANAAPANSVGIPNSTAETQANYGNFNSGANTEPTFTIYTPIEKSQIGKSGMWGEQDPHIQPSLHIGVQPVPALSTSALLLGDGVFNSWTDTRAYWEVTATMTIVEQSPTAWPYAAQANVPLGDVVMWIPNVDRPPMIANPSSDAATMAGLYPSTAAPITETA